MKASGSAGLLFTQALSTSSTFFCSPCLSMYSWTLDMVSGADEARTGRGAGRGSDLAVRGLCTVQDARERAVSIRKRWRKVAAKGRGPGGAAGKGRANGRAARKEGARGGPTGGWATRHPRPQGSRRPREPLAHRNGPRHGARRPRRGPPSLRARPGPANRAGQHGRRQPCHPAADPARHRQCRVGRGCWRPTPLHVQGALRRPARAAFEGQPLVKAHSMHAVASLGPPFGAAGGGRCSDALCVPVCPGSGSGARRPAQWAQPSPFHKTWC